MLAHLNTLAAVSNQSLWAAILQEDSTRLGLVVIAVCLLVLAVGMRTLWRLRPQPARQARSRPIRDQRGTATIEFALLFPIILFFVLLLTQTTMLLAGNAMVHYAAFAATRTAIVEIPLEIDGDEPNVYTQSDGRWKRERIRAAAAFATLPVAGQLDSGGGGSAAGDIQGAFEAFYSGYGRNAPGWVENMIAGKMRYALENTDTVVMTWERVDDNRIEFSEIGSGQSYEFTQRDAITVRVRHRLNLGVPYVNRIYADDRNPTGDGLYALVTAQYTLTNEGVRDELPPQPTIPRLTP
jgi:hypothetical protein